MTSPEATLLLDCGVTVPTVRPAPLIAALAATWVSPTTFGTLTWPSDPLPPQAVKAPAAITHIEPLSSHPIFLTAMCPSHPNFMLNA
jgi:hypothetical protein